MASDNKEERFKNELFKQNELCSKILFPKSEYSKVTTQLKLATENSKTKDRSAYYLLSKYEIMQCGDVEKLIKRRSNPEEPILFFVTMEETFDVVQRAHHATGHGGRDRMIKELQKKYAKQRFSIYALQSGSNLQLVVKNLRNVTNEGTLKTGTPTRSFLQQNYTSKLVGQLEYEGMWGMLLQKGGASNHCEGLRNRLPTQVLWAVDMLVMEWELRIVNNVAIFQNCTVSVVAF